MIRVRPQIGIGVKRSNRQQTDHSVEAPRGKRGCSASSWVPLTLCFSFDGGLRRTGTTQPTFEGLAEQKHGLYDVNISCVRL